MRTVWKYEIVVNDEVVIAMPEGAQILHVGSQHPEQIGVIQLWAGVDPERPPADRRFLIVGTGHPIPDSHIWHVGSTIQADGRLVWHVFEVEDVA